MRQVGLNNSTNEAIYHYDAAGQRVRKVVRLGSNTEERFYLGGWELYRKIIGSATDPDTERETLHVMDGERRVALAETLTWDGGVEQTSPTPVQRYQLGNHLDSVSAEVNEDGDLITYEEYHPYGTAAWRAADSSYDVSLKRYRYTGMERDDETGLAMHGVRFYAPWLGRWCSSDPIGMGGGMNRYGYARSSPTATHDRSGMAPLLAQRQEPFHPVPEQHVDKHVTEVSTRLIDFGSQVTLDSGESFLIPEPDFRRTPEGATLLPINAVFETREEALAAVAEVEARGLTANNGVQPLAFYNAGHAIVPTIVNRETAPLVTSARNLTLYELSERGMAGGAVLGEAVLTIGGIGPASQTDDVARGMLADDVAGVSDDAARGVDDAAAVAAATDEEIATARSFGKELLQELKKLERGKMTRLMERINEQGFKQEQALVAIDEASKIFGRTARIPLDDGRVVVSSVMPGEHIPVFVTEVSGRAYGGTARLRIDKDTLDLILDNIRPFGGQ